VKRRFNILLTHVSILFNSCLGGDYNQSWCARNYEWELDGKWNMVGTLDWLMGEYHCHDAWVYYSLIKKAQKKVSDMMEERDAT